MKNFKLIKTINLKDIKRVSKIRLVFLVIFFLLLLINTMTFFVSYARFNSKFDEVNSDNISGVSNGIVTIDDLKRDYDYYMGLNYTQTDDGTLPTGTKRNLYSDQNLVQTKIIYDGLDNDSNVRGYVSKDDQQSKYRYFKVYPVNTNGTSSKTDDYIEIELIDNPFTYRNVNKVFNGWTTAYRGVTITYDSDYYTRSAKIPVTYTDDEPDKIEITFNANWVNGTITTVSTSRNWATAFSALDAEGMKEIVSSTTTRVYEPYDMTGYYHQVILNRYDSLVGYYNNRGQRQTRGTCNSTTCTYYSRITNENYTDGEDYYHLVYGYMTLVDPDTLNLVVQSENIEYNEDIGNKNVAGYYRKKHFNNGATVGANYYDNKGNVVTRCSTNNGCDYYELIQYYDTNGNEEIAENNSSYYYLVTRDTNIIVMTNSMSTKWSSSENKPFTLTTEFNDYDTNATWTVAELTSDWYYGSYIDGIRVYAYSDLTIENIKIDCNIDFANLEDSDLEFSDVSNPTSRYGGFYGNYHNVKIGRGITRNGSNGNFIAVVGGNSSSNDDVKYRLMIEQGNYVSISNTNTPYNSTRNVPELNMIGQVVYGNDYDRVKNDNTLLDIYYCAAGSWGGYLYALDDEEVFMDLTVKSGTFGSGEIDHTTGIYVGGRYGGTHYSARRATILGGYIYNLIGGPLTASSRTNVNDTYIYVKGGTIDMITGGAGTSATYGNRIIQLTGGKINYSVFGGSNGYDGNNGDGTLRGASFVYSGGGVVVGDETLVENGDSRYGAEAGSIFGNGNGKSGTATIGSNDNSNVVIDEDAYINNNVYGGGNFSAVGVSKTSGTTTTNIWMHGGTVKGSIYGGGNNNGSGSTNITSTVNINVTNGTVDGAIYGGSNEQGVIYGSTNVNVTGGKIGSVFGGGKGGYIENDNTHPGTYVARNVTVTIGDSDIDPGPTITGEVFGGSAFGTVNGTTNNNSLSTYNTTVTVNNGTIGSVFGGGKGDSTYTPYVEGNATVTVNGGDITNVFGANDAAGTPNGNVSVYLKGGEVTNTYGGGNKTSVPTTNVYLQGATCTNIFGGSNETGDVNKSNVIATSGTATTIYGGNNKGGLTKDANVTLNGATATAIYGGGNIATTTKTTVTLTSGTVTDTYGGGKSADITETTTVIQNGATCTNIFGGSNSSGNVTTSNVTINAGTTGSVYGGNNEGGTTTTTNINLEGGKVTNVFGGGNQALSTTSNIKLDGTNTKNIYGGGNKAGLTTSNIDLLSGTATSVFGGSNQSGTVTTSNIKTLETTKTNINNQTEIDLSTTFTKNSTNVTVDGQTYLTTASITVTVTNNSSKTIKEWSGTVKAEDSILYQNSSNHDIAEDNGVYTFNQINRNDEEHPFELAPGESHSFLFIIYSKISASVFKIDDKSVIGISADGDSYVQNNSNLIVSNLYGGNNEGGLTETTNIDLTQGYVHNVYGGGNFAPVNNANVNCNGVSIGGQLYGGGNRAAVNNDAKINFINSSIIGSIYGGGNAGVVKGDTNVYISSSTIGENVYAGGNGSAAIVEGNTTATLDGTTNVGKNVFGGGNAAQTGTVDTNNSVSTVNIAGATIGGNVYGGANTSRVYGKTALNIGYNSIENKTELTKGDIVIKGTVFGGGEANASGSAIFDFNFISVTKGIDIVIDGLSHTNFTIGQSIFGSGNASSTSGYSNIKIANYGTANDIKRNISLQRASYVEISNSHLEFYGATDRTNDYATELFSISRVDELKLKNNSRLYLNTGTNLLKKFTSTVDIQDSEQLATVVINDDAKTVVKNVDNRLYVLEGKVVNIATNQNVTETGEVDGMTFFGMYQRSREGVISTSLYDASYSYGSDISTSDLYAFNKGSYVLGKHEKPQHNIKIDGFYSNFADTENSGKVKVAYIVPQPEEGDDYMWSIGEKVISYEMTLTASKYLTLGTTDLSFVKHQEANSTFTIVGFSYVDLKEDIDLVPENEIPRIAASSDDADKKMSLVMKTPSSGWMNKGQTQFVSDAENPYSGTLDYKRENIAGTPVLQFYLYHSKNIGSSGNMGEVVVSLAVITPISDLANRIDRVNVVIQLNRALVNTNDYEATAAPGKQYKLFAKDDINITTTGSFSNYYSLFTTQQNFYKEGWHRALVSDYAFPAKTKITLIDFHNPTDPEYYYYIVSSSDYATQSQEFEQNREVVYNFSRFIKMGSTSDDNTYSDAASNARYYNSSNHVSEEEFIAIVDFSESNIQENVIGKSLLIELQDEDNQTKVSILGVQQEGMKYNLIYGEDPVINVDAELGTENVYPGDEVSLHVTTDYIQGTYGAAPVIDTNALENQLGIKITLYDEEGHQVNGASLLGLSYELDGVLHYPRVDGSTRIKIAEKISNVLARIKIHTTSSLAPERYTMRIESFGSSDGIYYGLQSSDYVEIPFNVLNNVYGLEVTLPPKQVIIDKKTGKTLNGNNVVVFNYKYSSVLDNPRIRISMRRRRYNAVFSTEYELVDIRDYFTNEFSTTSVPKEYLLTSHPSDETNLFLNSRSNLRSGTYKVVFSLYDGESYIGEVYQYLIIK